MWFLLLSGACAGFACRGSSGGGSSPIAIGVVLDEADYPGLSRSLEFGLTMAYEEIRAAGGIQGKPLVLAFSRITALDPTGERAFQALLAAGIQVVISGPLLPSWLSAQASTPPFPLALVAGYPTFLTPPSPGVSPAPSFPPLPVTLSALPSAHLLFLGTSAELEPLAAARFLLGQFPSLREVGVIYEDSPWGNRMYQSFLTALPLGAPVVKPVRYPAGETSPNPRELEGFATASTPFALYLIAPPGVTPGFLSALKGALPPASLLFLSGSSQEPEDPSLLPVEVRNLFRIAPAPASTGTIELFAREYERRYGRGLDLYAAYGYDALFLLALALGEGGKGTLFEKVRRIASPPPEEKTHKIYPLDYRLAQELLSKGEALDYEGASGSFLFEESGERRDGYFTLYKAQMEEGRVRFSALATQPAEVPRAR